MKIGDRVITIDEVDKYPHFIVPKGKKGTILEYSTDIVRIRMDDYIEDCEEWDNEVHFYNAEWHDTNDNEMNAIEQFNTCFQQIPNPLKNKNLPIHF